MTGTLVNDLIGIADSLYGVRDAIGATKELVFIVTRTWSGASPGDGTFTDAVRQVLPSPAIEMLKSDWRARQAGIDDSGDTMLKGISKQSYAARTSVDCTSTDPKVERFYKIAGKLFSVVSVEEKYISWEVRIKKVAHQG